MGILDEQLHIEGASINNDVKVESDSHTALFKCFDIISTCRL